MLVMLGGSGFGEKLKKMKGGGEMDSGSDDESMDEVAELESMKAFGAALAAKKWKAARTALKTFIETCYPKVLEGHPSDDEDSESDSEDADEY